MGMPRSCSYVSRSGTAGPYPPVKLRWFSAACSYFIIYWAISEKRNEKAFRDTLLRGFRLRSKAASVEPLFALADTIIYKVNQLIYI